MPMAEFSRLLRITARIDGMYTSCPGGSCNGILHKTFVKAMRTRCNKWYSVFFVAFLATAQVRDSSLRPNHAASLTIEVRHAITGELVPARVYLFRGATPHRLSPVDNLLPL